MNSLASKRAIVTGAGSGIGRAVVRHFASEGAEVLGIDVAEASLVETIAPIPGASWAAVDVRSDECLAAIERYGPCDVLVNAAGILRRHAFVDHNLLDWQDTLDVNVRAPFRLSRQFAADHVSRGAGGSIINVCSIESFIALPEHAAYTSSKTALLMLTRAFALELAPHGIRVVGVAPGVTETAMNRDARANADTAEELRNAIPLGRFGAPNEIATVIAFLASDQASYLTGTVVLADGGWHLY